MYSSALQYWGMIGSSSRNLKSARAGAFTGNQPQKPGVSGSAASRYDVLERNGEGTLFVVYRVRDIATQSIYALKALKGVYSRHRQFAGAIATAAQASSSLRHPQLASLFEVGREEDTLYIVEEWLPGGTLEKRMRRAPFGQVETTTLAIRVLDGLIALHENGIAHGDVRPKQILFNGDGMAKLNDIGFAAAYPAANMEITDVQIEAAYYQAPERWDGQAASPRADLYALGVVLYRAVTGRVPFDGTSPLAIAMRHRSDKPLRPAQFNPGCPRELEEFILRLLEKNPAQRFSSAREALQVLAPEHRPIPVQRVSAGKVPVEMAPAKVTQAAELPVEEAKAELVASVTPIAAAAATPIAAPIPVAPAEPVVPVESVPVKPAPEKTVAQRRLQAKPQEIAPVPVADAEEEPLAKMLPSQPEPDTKRLRRREMLGAFMALFCTVLAASILFGICYGAYAYWMKEAPPEVPVPKYQGLNQADAQAILRKAGLEMKIGKEVYNPKKPAGTILGGDPAPGKKVREGRTITVTVSRGEEPVRMVDFTELTLEQARQVLAKHGMRMGQVAEQYHDRVPKGGICGQFPEPGEMFRRSEPINLVVSRGPQPSGSLTEPPIDPVTSQNAPVDSPPPAPQQDPLAPAQEEILVTREAVVSVALPADGGPQELKIIVKDAEGEYVAYQQAHEAGDVIDKTIQVVRAPDATATVLVYIGGRLVREMRV
jgi:tRNA A-37 threonylcarbamoyl transferase component Bud32